ncbi:MAG: ATP-binding protein [Elusimicrobiota bacterium]
MQNPFVYGQEVFGEIFCNRTKEIKELVSDIISGQNVIVYSPRRYGKTSLIKEVLKKAEKEGVVGIYVDLYAVLKEEDFVSIYAAAISKTLSGSMEKIISNLKNIFKSLRPKIVINPQGDTEIGVDLIKDTNMMIEDVGSAVKRYADKYKKQVVVVFDEFQQIGLLGTDKIEKRLRGIVQTHGRKVSYIFMGSKKHLIYDMFSNPNRPFYKIGRHYPIGKISSDKLTSFVVERFKSTGMNIPENIAKKIVDIAECHPYYVQHLGSSVWKLAEHKRIDEKTVEDALTLTLAEEKSAYSNIWDELSLNQKKVLKMLVESGQENKIYSIENLQKFNLTASVVQKTIKSLLLKELIDKSNGSYNINDVFFKQWLIRI